MADQLPDLYPIPVEFVPGQQPTSAFLNAWSAQVDAAFDLISQIIGDFSGGDTALSGLLASDGYRGEGMIANITRLLGNVGWLDCQLPSGIVDQNVVENLGGSIGKKEALLSFVPELVGNSDPNEGTLLNANREEWANFPSGHANTNKWAAQGRQVRLLRAITAADTVQYRIDTDTPGYKERYRNNSGSVLVPGLADMAVQMAGNSPVLCTLGALANGKHTLSFPEIKTVVNPSKGLSLNVNDLIKIKGTDDVLASGELQWKVATPKYKVPPWIRALATAAGNIIPQGLASLWKYENSKLQRVNTATESNVVFSLVANQLHQISITPPDGLTLNAGDNYVVAFAGASVSESVAHNHYRIADHKHDGSDESAPIDAAALTNRFDHTKYTHSTIDENHFPQYLHRKGYDFTDSLNGYNILLGDLVLGGASFSEGDLTESADAANSQTAPSRSIWFGSSDILIGAPRLTWKDISTEVQAEGFVSGAKLVLDSLPTTAYPPLLVRSGELYLGSNENYLPDTKGKIVFSPYSEEAPNTGGWTEPTAKKNLVLQFNAGTVVATNPAVKQYKRLSLLTERVDQNSLSTLGTELSVGRVAAGYGAIDEISVDVLYNPYAAKEFYRYISATNFEYESGIKLEAMNILNMFNPAQLHADADDFWGDDPFEVSHSDHSDHATLKAARKKQADLMWNKGAWEGNAKALTASVQGGNPVGFATHGIIWRGPLDQENTIDGFLAENFVSVLVRLDQVMPAFLSDEIVRTDQDRVGSTWDERRLSITGIYLHYSIEHNGGRAPGSQKSWYSGTGQYYYNRFYEEDANSHTGWTTDGNGNVYAKNQVPNKRVFEVHLVEGVGATALTTGYNQIFSYDADILDVDGNIDTIIWDKDHGGAGVDTVSSKFPIIPTSGANLALVVKVKVPFITLYGVTVAFSCGLH